MARLFFALWPAEDAADALASLAQAIALRVEGKATPREKIHLTLAFLGDVEEARLGEALAVARSIRGEPFTLALDRLGSFRRARVAWAGATAPGIELPGLASRLGDALRAAGFALEDRPFAPHVTLVRRTGRALPSEAMPPVSWRVSDFRLVRSELGTGRYTTLERWPFG